MDHWTAMEHLRFQDHSIARPFDRLRAVSTVEPLLHCSKVNALCAFTLALSLQGIVDESVGVQNADGQNLSLPQPDRDPLPLDLPHRYLGRLAQVEGEGGLRGIIDNPSLVRAFTLRHDGPSHASCDVGYDRWRAQRRL